MTKLDIFEFFNRPFYLTFTLGGVITMLLSSATVAFFTNGYMGMGLLCVGYILAPEYKPTKEKK